LLDLGVGTGAIGLSLLDELRGRGVPAHLIGIDLSREALDLATHNAKKHGLMSVTFCHGSWYQPLDDSLRGTFDLITANPPYIGEDDFASLDPVLRHEPRSALVAASSHGVPGLADIAYIIDGAPQWLRPGGSLVLEHGFDQRDAVLSVARAAGATSCEDWDDMAGNPRILVATW
jgi:release factor glutamine methyltransferase